MQSRFILEIATSDFHGTKAAVLGGADRIELCSNLGEGGTTPSYAHLRKCRESFTLPIFPIIRPRGGDFLYTDEEFDIIKTDVLLCKQLGFDGVVLGLLMADGAIDVARTSKLVEAAYPLSVTFHRAFDRCKDPFAAIEQLVHAGCERILTSGQQPTAPLGAALIRQLEAAAAGRITIMPGSGVRQENIAALAAETGCVEFHTSLRTPAQTGMKFIHPAFRNDNESYSHSTVLQQKVADLVEAVRAIPISNNTDL